MQCSPLGKPIRALPRFPVRCDCTIRTTGTRFSLRDDEPGSTPGMRTGYGMMMFFDGFTLDETGPLRMRVGGAGPPLLLLHGQAQTHAMWHAVAGRLADRFPLIGPDLPPHLNETVLASDMLALMTRLGHDQFQVAGHDLGAHVACH